MAVMTLVDEVENRNLSSHYLTEFEDLMREVEGEVEAAAGSYDLAVEMGETMEYFTKGKKEVSTPGDIPNRKVTVYQTPYEVDHQEVVESFQDIREERGLPSDPDKVVPEVAEELDMSIEVTAYAHDLLKLGREEDSTFLNSGEDGLAGGAVYFAALMRNEKKTQSEVAEVLDANARTVGRHYNNMRELL